MAYTLGDLSIVLRDPNGLVFTEEDLAVYLTASPDSIWRAAGQAVTSLSIEYATQGKSIKTDDLAIDLRGRGADLTAVAKSFFAMADADGASAASDFFQIVPFGGRIGREEATYADSGMTPIPSGIEGYWEFS